MNLSEKAQAALQTVIRKIETGDLTDMVQALAIAPDPNAPCLKWSFTNRALVAMQKQTQDARGFAQCGPKKKSCWRQLGADGYRYDDPDLAASGVRTIDLVASASRGGRIRISAKRAKGKTALPRLTQGLADNTFARVFVLSTDGRCFGAVFSDVKVNDANAFKATNPK